MTLTNFSIARDWTTLCCASMALTSNPTGTVGDFVARRSMRLGFKPGLVAVLTGETCGDEVGAVFEGLPVVAAGDVAVDAVPGTNPVGAVVGSTFTKWIRAAACGDSPSGLAPVAGDPVAAGLVPGLTSVSLLPVSSLSGPSGLMSIRSSFCDIFINLLYSKLN